jgi:hypothetical protein
VGPDRHDAYTVFAQRSDAALDLNAIRSQAVRFFDAKIGLTADRNYGADIPLTDSVELMIARNELKGTRRCHARPAELGDYLAAESAERMQNTSGMALLAQRCRTVWLVVPETDSDPAALLIATILASTLLGPILAPSGTELFGVRTARIKLGL